VPAGAAPRSDRARDAATLPVTVAIQVLVVFASMRLPVAAPVMAARLSFPVTQTGTFMAAMFAASMLATLCAGPLVARFGAIRVSQGGLLLCGLGFAVCAIPSRACFALGVMFVGLGYGPITPASSHLLAMTTLVHRLSMVFSLK